MQKSPQNHLIVLKGRRSLQSWNNLIQSSTRNELFSESLDLYYSMLHSGINGDNFTFPFVAKSCAKLKSIRDGKKIHNHTLLLGFHSHVFVQTSLLDMYSKCSHLEDARQVFDEMPVRTLVSWNSIVSAYSHHMCTSESFHLFNEMRWYDIDPSSSTLVSIVSGCRDWYHVSAVYCYAVKVMFDKDIVLSNTVMNMYVKFGLVDQASSIFNSMELRSNVSWSIIMNGYAKVNDMVKVFDHFAKMRMHEVELDAVTFICLVSQCVYSTHSLLIKNGLVCDLKIAASMVTAYAKYNDIVASRKVFEYTSEKDVSLWTAMIGAFKQCGLQVEAFNLFRDLLNSNIKPNEVTIVTILSSCADFGLLSIGEEVEEYVRSMGLLSNLKVCTSLIQMYCQCGCVDRARTIFDGVKTKDLAIWSAMIKGYACDGRGREALTLFKKMKDEERMKPDEIVFTDVLSACRHSGFVEEGLKYFDSMRRDYGLEPNEKHHACIVDLLARSGHAEYAAKFVAAQAQSDVRDGISNEEFGSSDEYVKMSNECASLGKWKEATEFRRLMDHKGFAKEAGWSKII